MARVSKKKSNHRESFFEKIAHTITQFTGGTKAFVIALLLVLVWLISGPIFNYSEGWQLVINTGTTIITFLMVFLIQRTQNKDSMAIQLKLNELIAAVSGASNRLIDVEDMSEKDLEILKNYYNKLTKLTEEHGDLTKSHSVEEAEKKHKQKLPSLK